MNQNNAEFILDTNEEMATAIRRSANEIEILAIDEVEIHKNDSALYDEILAHRLGLIPLQATKNVEMFKGGDKPSTKNQAQIHIKIKGPGIVYSGDIKGEVKPVYDKILVNPLKEKIKSGDIYKSTKDIDYLKNFSEEGDIEVKPGKEIIMFIESWGQKSPKEIFNESVKTLNHNLKGIIKKVSGSRRKRLELNLDEIDGQTKDNDLVIIPGIVLGKGNIKKKIKISAMKYTESAKEKLKESKIEFNLIEEEIKSNPEGKGIKVLT